MSTIARTPASVHGIDALRLAQAEYVGHDAFIVGDPQLAPFDAERRPADEELVRLVPQEDAGPIGCEHFCGRFGHLREQRLHLLGLIPTAGDFQEGRQAFAAAALLLRGTHRDDRLRERRHGLLRQLLNTSELGGVGKVHGEQLAGQGAAIEGDDKPSPGRGGRFAIEGVGQERRRERGTMARGIGSVGGRDRPAAVDIADDGRVVGTGQDDPAGQRRLEKRAGGRTVF